MPVHKGIKLSVISQWELKVHPEFPHPETTQFTYRASDGEQGPLFEDSIDSPATRASDSKADRLLGARFFVRYNVIDAAAESKWYYFKLFMNSRHIASWGTNSRTRPSGQVMRAFFEPDEKFDYKEGKKIFKDPGTEQRSFFFTEEREGSGVAEDGGIIEVQVFRARGRKRLAQHVEAFKDQSQWGIVMPSGGLVDRPQDGKYFEWHLKDAKDNPFVTFKFHYRSWDNLVNLNLIPPSHSRSLMRQTPSMMRLPTTETEIIEVETPKKYLGKLYTSDQIHDALRVAYYDECDSESSDDTTAWIPQSLDSNQQESSKKKDNRDTVIVPPDCESFYHLPSKFSATLVNGAAHSQDWLTTAYNRPLPEIPSRNSSVSHSRPLSAASRAPSVTPSLISYLERDQTSPEPYVGDAIAVSIDGSGDASNENSISSHVENSSEPDGSAILTGNANRQATIIPTSFSLPKVTFRKAKKSPDKPSPIKISTKYSSPLKIINGPLAVGDNDDSHTGTLSLTESEWMCRTPSPVRNDPEYSCIERKLWSPGLDLEDKYRSSGRRKGNEYGDGDVNVHLRFDLDLSREDELVMNWKEDNGNAKEDERPSGEEGVNGKFVVKSKVEEHDLRDGNWI